MESYILHEVTILILVEGSLQCTVEIIDYIIDMESQSLF